MSYIYENKISKPINNNKKYQNEYGTLSIKAQNLFNNEHLIPKQQGYLKYTIDDCNEQYYSSFTITDSKERKFDFENLENSVKKEAFRLQNLIKLANNVKNNIESPGNNELIHFSQFSKSQFMDSFNEQNWNSKSLLNQEAAKHIDLHNLVNLCSLCETIDEPQRAAIMRRFFKRSKSEVKPRVKYIVPKLKKMVKIAQDGEIVYQINIITGKQANAGTSAKGSILFIGSKGETDFNPLIIPVDKKFKPGSNISLNIISSNVGKLNAITIQHDGTERIHDWFIDKILVVDTSRNIEYEFFCRKWLSKYIDGCKTCRTFTLYPQEIVIDKKQNKIPRESFKTPQTIEYVVQVFTGDKIAAGTNANVFLTMYGEKGNIVKQQLINEEEDSFERNKKDTFYLKSKNIGEITSIKIEHDNSGIAAGWFLEKIVIAIVSLNKVWKFICHSWLANNEGDKQICKILKPEPNEKPLLKNNIDANSKEYVVQVFTGDKNAAGTNANVFLTIYGEKDNIVKQQLINKGEDSFERNKKDTFYFKNKNIGEITSIKIEHDNSGIAAGWFLEKIVIAIPSLNKLWNFICHSWLAKNEGDQQIFKILKPEPNQEHIHKKTIDENSKGYEIHVLTGNNKNAGTTANIILYVVSESQTKLINLQRTHKNNFSSANNDTFKFPDLKYLGKIEMIKIEHDNSGRDPAWLLEEIQIIDHYANQVYKFKCSKWLASEKIEIKPSVILKPNAVIEYVSNFNRSNKNGENIDFQRRSYNEDFNQIADKNKNYYKNEPLGTKNAVKKDSRSPLRESELRNRSQLEFDQSSHFDINANTRRKSSRASDERLTNRSYITSEEFKETQSITPRRSIESSSRKNSLDFNKNDINSIGHESNFYNKSKQYDKASKKLPINEEAIQQSGDYNNESSFMKALQNNNNIISKNNRNLPNYSDYKNSQKKFEDQGNLSKNKFYKQNLTISNESLNRYNDEIEDSIENKKINQPSYGSKLNEKRHYESYKNSIKENEYELSKKYDLNEKSFLDEEPMKSIYQKNTHDRENDKIRTETKSSLKPILNMISSEKSVSKLNKDNVRNYQKNNDNIGSNIASTHLKDEIFEEYLKPTKSSEFKNYSGFSTNNHNIVDSKTRFKSNNPENNPNNNLISKLNNLNESYSQSRKSIDRRDDAHFNERYEEKKIQPNIESRKSSEYFNSNNNSRNDNLVNRRVIDQR